MGIIVRKVALIMGRHGDVRSAGGAGPAARPDRGASQPDAAADIRLLGEQGQRLTGLIARIAERAAVRTPPLEIDAPLVDAILEVRRLRAVHFGAKLADPAWTLLLAAYAARLDGRYCSPAKLRDAADLSHATASRWLHRLHQGGLMTWEDDPEDGRGALVNLSEPGAARVEAYLKAALRISPVIV